MRAGFTTVRGGNQQETECTGSALIMVYAHRVGAAVFVTLTAHGE